MKTVTVDQMRELDRRTIAEAVPGAELMERAGVGVAAGVRELADEATLRAEAVVLVAGKGNNGGDAFVAARHLVGEGREVTVLLVAPPDAYHGDAREHLQGMTATEGIAWRHVEEGAWDEEVRRFRSRRVVVVDAVLGTGVQGAARGAAAVAIDAINALGTANRVVAVDIPSGMNADTGEAEGVVVTADLTVTMALPKRGLVESCAVPYVGNVVVVDIGVPDALAAALAADVELVTPADVCGLMGRVRRDAHKGTNGHLLIVGGSAGFSGATVIAARAALRSGVGLVSMLVPRSVADVVAAQVPEAMVHGAAQTDEGRLAADALASWSLDPGTFDAVLLGPGMGTCRETQTLVERVLAGSRVPLVLDADGLNACANRAYLIKRARCPVVITPHPGEMARLLADSVKAVQAERQATAGKVATTTGAVVVLKGAGTVIATPEGALHVNCSGNPGMATGGMGDALSGFMSGLAAQGHPTSAAARAAVYLHGRAGDLAAGRLSMRGLCVTDLPAHFPDALCELARRR